MPCNPPVKAAKCPFIASKHLLPAYPRSRGAQALVVEEPGLRMIPGHGIRVVMCAVAVGLLFASRAALAGEAKIYVIREADGALRFTNKPPGAGQDAQVFTSTGNGGQFYRAVTPVRMATGERVFNGSRASLRLPLARRLHNATRGRGGLYPDLYSEEIDRASSDHDVDPALVRAVIHAESAFNPYAVSPKGARGLMQLMPATARMLGVKNSFSPGSNIWGGTKYLAQLLRRFRNESHAIAAYNAGEVPVNRYNGVPPYSETREYVRRVLSLKKQYTLTLNG